MSHEYQLKYKKGCHNYYNVSINIKARYAEQSSQMQMTDKTTITWMNFVFWKYI